MDTLIEVNEADGNVTLNVSITSPVTGIEIMFRLNVDSVDGSAGMDYIPNFSRICSIFL